MKTSVVKVGKNYRITIPKYVRKKLSIVIGDSLIVDIQNDILVLIKEPKKYTNKLRGLYSEIWKDLDTQKYLSRERDSWTN